VIKKTKITRFVSSAVAAACLATGLNFAPFTMEIEAADQLTAFEITEAMQIGWNLGNTLDAYMSDAKHQPLESYGLEAETCWGNPKTTPELIAAVKAKGFNTIRVPVTWFQHVDKNNGYKIDEAWLARVKEIVDYCYEQDMYVILNLHHEEPYVNRSTLGADYEELTGYVSSLWKQIAETFKDYDQRLVFETMNEPRAKGTDHEWWGPTKEETDTINKINADALEVIRGTGNDNNDTRLVMMPGYCASSDTSMMSKIVVPDDEYVAVSVHAYSPYNFTMNAEVKDHSTFTAAYATELTSILDGIRKTFGDKDIPVVLGEFSASNFGNTEARVEWAKAYISQTKEMGIPCVLWDNNVEKNNGGEAHGYINRSNLTWYEGSETVVDTMMDVIKDDSIVWGSGRKSPTIEHDDIDSGFIVSDDTHELDASVKDGNCTPGLNATWKELEGGDVAVQYTGDQPVIAVVDGDWLNWTEIKAYDDKDGIAYYSAKHIASAWGEDKVDEIAHLFVRTNSTTTVTKIAIIGEGKGEIEAPPEDKTKKYEVDFANRGDSNTLTFTIEGKAGSTTNGCVGYMGDEWTNIEWDGKIGADGKLNVEVDITTIPASVKSAQIQIWWCDDENGEMTVYNFKSADVVEPTTEPTEAPTTAAPQPTEPTEAPSVPSVPATLYGDANNDGKITIADAAAILQTLSNSDKYPLSEQGAANSDVNGVTGITVDDAIVIMKIDAKLLEASELPLKA
ncbi:MAG: cellulase family glycosylhydrolase, partial [Ruminococcus sp.]|nr:cellulase family glycosylhydrolase [Ruminococcus sp.]